MRDNLGESGEKTINRTLKAVCQSKSLGRDDLGKLHLGFSLPRIAIDAHCDAIREEIDSKGLKALFIDPAYLAMLSGAAPGSKSSDLFAMGPILKNYGDIGADTGCTMCLVHHTKKSSRCPWPTLDDLSQSGFAEWARQWVLIGRRSRYVEGSGKHELNLVVGGSAGHSGRYGVQVDEGRQDGLMVTDKIWEVNVLPIDEAEALRQQKEADMKEAKKSDRKNQIVSAIATSGGNLSANGIREHTRIRIETINDLLEVHEQTHPSALVLNQATADSA